MLDASGPLYIYYHVTMPNKSYIDHIIVSEDLKNKISNTKVLDHHPLNTGDHLPVVTSITSNTQIENNPDAFVSTDHQFNQIPNYMWKNEKFTQKYNTLTEHAFADMSYKHLPLEEELESMNNTLKECASRRMLEMNFSTHKVTPKSWWNSDLSNAKKKLQQMFNLWKAEGFPKSESNIAYGRYKFARKAFRYQIRQSKNQTSANHYINVDKLKNIKPRLTWDQIVIVFCPPRGALKVG